MIKVQRELRWFVDGDIDPALLPTGRPARRCDLYHVPSLTPVSSLKRRGRRDALEYKVRVGRVELVEHGDLCGFAETWVKDQLRTGRPLDDSPKRWIEVRKELWCRAGAEVARVTIGRQRWWSVCIDSDTPSKAAAATMARWAPTLASRGESLSYAAWLLQLGGRT